MTQKPSKNVYYYYCCFSFLWFSLVDVGNQSRRDLKRPGHFRLLLKGAEPPRPTISSFGFLPGRASPLCPPTNAMLRSVFLRTLPRLGRPAVCRYSAAAIPVPNTQPEVHFNKVSGCAAVAAAPELANCAINKCVFPASTSIKN